MASRISFYCAVFLGMLLYDTSEALSCYTHSSCSGAGCTGRVNRDPVVTECHSYSNACLKVSSEATVNGYKAYYTGSSCGTIGYGLRKGCSSLDDLPPSAGKLYENKGYDSLTYCLCDQDLCNTGSITATFTLPVMIGCLLFTLLVFFRQS